MSAKIFEFPENYSFRQFRTELRALAGDPQPGGVSPLWIGAVIVFAVLAKIGIGLFYFLKLVFGA